MDNDYYKTLYNEISEANIDQLHELKKQYEMTINDPFDDGDETGDMAITYLSNFIDKRLRELCKN